MLKAPENLFQALSDSTRLRCVMLLMDDAELCVCELTYTLDLPQPKVSRHLALLRKSGVLLDRRQGQWVYYRINPELPAWAHAVLETIARGNAPAQPFAADRRRLLAMPERPGRQCCAQG